MRVFSRFPRLCVHNLDMAAKTFVVFGVAFGLFAGALGGSTSAQEPKNTEAPSPIGRMIDLGGYRLHLNCVGQGKPTVLLSIGGGGFSTDWALVQSKVAAFTRF